MPSIGVVELFIILCLFGLIVFGAILLVAGFGWWSRYLGVGATVEGRAERLERLPAAGITTLDLTNPVGDVEIAAGSSDEITIRTVKIARGRSTEEARQRAEAMALRIEPVGDRLVLVAPTGRMRVGMKQEQVDWQISVPADLAVHVDSSVGPVLLRGMRGRADVSTEVGGLRARDCSFVAPTTLRTTTGSIEWEGALGSREGHYRVISTAGRVAIDLPSDNAFTLDAQTSVGSINCVFPVEGPSVDQLVGDMLRGAVNGGGPTLTIRTTTGSITLAASEVTT
ncbi:MAG: hypothetical protein M5U01_42900 [Ardenticatenaceae bacterium]|nr:hypothetical protein [Ardenticatenaceae bacterium]HBY96749.1 hypothetical protein [Chloroflexota bacterium]